MTLRYEFIAHRGCLWRICKMDSGLLKNGKLKNDQLQASSQRGAAKSKGRPDCQPKRKEDVKKEETWEENSDDGVLLCNKEEDTAALEDPYSFHLPTTPKVLRCKST